MKTIEKYIIVYLTARSRPQKIGIQKRTILQLTCLKLTKLDSTEYAV